MSTPQSEVLEYLKSGYSLTVLSCWQIFHTTELRRIVSRLKKEGHKITGTMQELNGRRFKSYKYAAACRELAKVIGI